MSHFVIESSKPLKGKPRSALVQKRQRSHTAVKLESTQVSPASHFEKMEGKRNTHLYRKATF